jgi:hypothetical protein
VRRCANLEVLRVVEDPVGVVVGDVVLALLPPPSFFTLELESTMRKAIANAMMASGASNRAGLLLDRPLI